MRTGPAGGVRKPSTSIVAVVLPVLFSTVGTLAIAARVSRPPVTLPRIEYCGSAVAKSLWKIRNWLPFTPFGLPTTATVPLG